MAYFVLDIWCERFCAYPVAYVPPALWRFFPVRGGRWLRRILGVIASVGLSRCILRKTRDPLDGCGCSVDDLAVIFRKLFPRHHVDCAFAWPAPCRSAGRLYAYAYAETGEFVSYVKIATEEKDGRELDHEVEVLRRLSSREDLPFSVPEVLSSGILKGRVRYAAFSFLPVRCEMVHWSSRSWNDSLRALHDSFAVDTCRHLEVEETLGSDWAKMFKRRAAVADCALLDRVCQMGADVSANHGDMALHNIRFSEGNWWIFDWETYADDAPALVDELTVYVCTRYFVEKCGYDELLVQMKSDYPVTERVVAARVMQACAFIYANKLSFADVFLKIFGEYGKCL